MPPLLTGGLAQAVPPPHPTRNKTFTLLGKITLISLAIGGVWGKPILSGNCLSVSKCGPTSMNATWTGGKGLWRRSTGPCGYSGGGGGGIELEISQERIDAVRQCRALETRDVKRVAEISREISELKKKSGLTDIQQRLSQLPRSSSEGQGIVHQGMDLIHNLREANSYAPRIVTLPPSPSDSGSASEEKIPEVSAKIPEPSEKVPKSSGKFPERVSESFSRELPERMQESSRRIPVGSVSDEKIPEVGEGPNENGKATSGGWEVVGKAPIQEHRYGADNDEEELRRIVLNLTNSNKDAEVLEPSSVLSLLNRIAQSIPTMEDRGTWVEGMREELGGDGEAVGLSEVINLLISQKVSGYDVADILHVMAKSVARNQKALSSKETPKEDAWLDPETHKINEHKLHSEMVREAQKRGRTTLPFGWKAAYDKRYRRLYYYNHNTGQRTWIRPSEDTEKALGDNNQPSSKHHKQLEASLPTPKKPQKTPISSEITLKNPASSKITQNNSMYSKMKQNHPNSDPDTTQGSQDVTQLREETSRSSPEGKNEWMRTIDPKTQRRYYYNLQTGERTWIKPLQIQQRANGISDSALIV